MAWLTVPESLVGTAEVCDVQLSVEGLSAHYLGQERWVLDEVCLSNLAGQVSAVVGPSGCGKTTLVRTICGLVPHCLPSEYRGSVKLQGVEIADASVQFIAERVAYVGQNPDAAIITRSVHDDIAFALQNLCLPGCEIETRVRDAAEKVGLTDYLWADPWTLSGGQRQRLAIAVVLAMSPKLLVLDEPTSNIDALGRQQFYQLISQLVAAGTGVVVIDHDLDPILPIVDQVIALDAEGAVIAAGPPRQVFYQHTTQLEQAGIWLPRAVRAGNTQALTCQEAEIELPGLERVCGSQVRYWRKETSGWRLVEEIDNCPKGQPQLELKDFAVPGRSPAIRARLAGGEFVGLLGQNGAGKTSLLSALAGLLRFDGQAQLEGSRMRKGKHGIGYVFQNPEHQMVAATVEKELAVGGADAQTVEDLLARFHLEAVSQQHPLTLSGGQQRRLSVATMVAEQRAIIVLDEPTFGQDWDNTCELMDFIGQLCAQGHTVLMATHDIELALDNCSHLIALPARQSQPAESRHNVRENRRGLFSALNPLTLFFALLPLMVTIFVVKQASLNLTLLCLETVLMFAARAQRMRTLIGVLAPWAATGFLFWVFSRADVLENISKMQDPGDALTAGSGIGALLSLIFLSGMASQPEELLVTMSTTFKVPYRITSAGTAAVAFVTRFSKDFALIRTAKALRGVGDKAGPLAPALRWFGSFLPLAILAVQHGERVALSMDSRGFGAYRHRTELLDVPWRLLDWIVVAALWGLAFALWFFWLA